MTVSTTKNKIEYVGDGNSKDFPLPFKFYREMHIKALLIKPDKQQETFTAFTVEGAGDENGGTAHTNSPIPQGTKILFYRELDIVQEDDFRDNNPAFAETIEKNSDKTVMKLQQLEETLKRCAKVPITSPDNPETLLADSIAKCADSEQKAAVSAQISQEQAAIATQQATISSEAAAFADNVVDGFDAHAAEKQNEIDNSANAAAQSAAAALLSETNSAASATSAAESQVAALDSQIKASASATEAKSSETQAKHSETAAKESETNAKASETQAQISETKAKESEVKALSSADSAAHSASEAERFRNEAEEIANLPEMSETVKGAVMAATEAEVLAGLIDNKAITPKKLNLHLGNHENPHQVTAEQLGLGQVDNTADSDKPVSNAVQTLVDNMIYPNTIYQQRVVLTETVIPLQESRCRYFRNVVSGDSYTIDISSIKQTNRDITFELILRMTAVVPVNLAAIVGNPGKWLNEDIPDFSEVGEYWLAFTSSDGGASWRGSYEGMFTL